MRAVTIVFILCIAHAQALSCFTWAEISLSPLWASVCAFTDPDPSPTEKATVDMVKGAASDFWSGVKILVEEHPLTVEGKWVYNAIEHNVSPANQQFKKDVSAWGGISIGVAKSSANAGVMLMDLLLWVDFNFCMMAELAKDVQDGASGSDSRGANDSRVVVDTTPNSSTQRKRATVPQQQSLTAEAISKVGSMCQNGGIAPPFNIKDPNEKAGGTLLDLAGFLVAALPIGVEAGAGEVLSKEGFDLVIPEVKDASVGRIRAKLPDGGVGSFKSEEEALTVKQKLSEDAEWGNTHCELRDSPIANVNNLKARHSRIARRAGGFLDTVVKLLCCDVPADSDEVGPILGVNDGTAAPTLPEVRRFPLEELTGPPRPRPAPADLGTYDPRARWYGNPAMLAESEVLSGDAAPHLVQWQSATTQKTQILADLASSNAAHLDWSADMLAAFSDESELFTTLRSIFKPSNAAEQELADFVQPLSSADGSMAFDDIAPSMKGQNWVTRDADKPILKRLQDFAAGATAHVSETCGTLQNVLPADAGRIKGITRFEFLPEGAARTRPLDPRGLELRGPALEMISADQPGLVVGRAQQLYRVAEPEKGSTLLKGKDWRSSPGETEGSAYTVFGPEAAAQGRVSVRSFVFDGGNGRDQMHWRGIRFGPPGP